ncbi:MAG: chorismate mutase [Clostridia bacterium]|nr:chorismate mutase [Clostridia bacterium]MBR4054177.1 chorismate mutase [Clostridia bacterium]
MDIKDYRDQLDVLDAQLVELFCRRMEICGDVARWKKENGKPIFDRGRERDKLNAVGALSKEEFEPYVRCMFRSLFGYSRSYQHKLTDPPSALAEEINRSRLETPELFPTEATVACQGVEGAYSSLACEKLFRDPEIKFFPTFEDVFKAVDEGTCRYGILPIENSTAGSVKANYDLLVNYQCNIVRSTRLLISHCLLAKPGVKLSDIKVIYSHEQAIGQCSKFLSSLAGVKVKACANTAMAAQMVSTSDDPSIAAISSRSCAELYGLSILAETIQDTGANRTRFICISKKKEIYPGANRTTLILVLKHKPGALFSVLERCNELGVNLVKLESRPLPERDFEFLFYLDLDIPAASPALYELIALLEAETEELRYLGSYLEVV